MDTLLMLNNLGCIEEYYDSLRDFLKQHTVFCAFTLDHADVITSGTSEQIPELCKDLRRLAQKLGMIAAHKADQYQKLYESFIANRELLSDWLDSGSVGQGRLSHLVLYVS